MSWWFQSVIKWAQSHFSKNAWYHSKQISLHFSMMHCDLIFFQTSLLWNENFLVSKFYRHTFSSKNLHQLIINHNHSSVLGESYKEMFSTSARNFLYHSPPDRAIIAWVIRFCVIVAMCHSGNLYPNFQESYGISWITVLSISSTKNNGTKIPRCTRQRILLTEKINSTFFSEHSVYSEPTFHVTVHEIVYLLTAYDLWPTVFILCRFFGYLRICINYIWRDFLQCRHYPPPPQSWDLYSFLYSVN